MYFRFLYLFFLEYSWIWVPVYELGRSVQSYTIVNDITMKFLVVTPPSIYQAYFTWLCYSNSCFLGGKVFSNVIRLLPILCKQLVTVCQGTGSSSHTPLTTGFLRVSRSFFGVGQFSSFHQKTLIFVDAGSSNSLVTVTVSCSDELSAPDYMGINSQ